MIMNITQVKFLQHPETNEFHSVSFILNGYNVESPMKLGNAGYNKFLDKIVQDGSDFIEQDLPEIISQHIDLRRNDPTTFYE